MILKRTCRERAREVYLKVFGGIVVLLLGPWIGMQAYVVLESEGDRYFRYFEIPNICLCSLLFLVSVLMICNIESPALFFVWVGGSVVCIVGHWVVLLRWQGREDTVESKEEVMTGYAIATALYGLFLVFAVYDTVVFVTRVKKERTKEDSHPRKTRSYDDLLSRSLGPDWCDIQ